MQKAFLIANGREIAIGEEPATIGRASDNTAAFPEDSNVSRYHAQIEWRDGELVITDLGSSNGTAVNGQTVTHEAALRDGDSVVLGGSSEFTVRVEAEPETADDAPANLNPGSMPAAGFETPAVAASGASAGAGTPTSVLLVAGAVVGLAIVLVFAAGLVYFAMGSKCEARAAIMKPEPGDTIIEPVEIEVEAEDTGCVSRAVFLIDGVEFASSDEFPYSATLDPAQFPELADGLDHNLEVVLIDEDGEKIPGGAPVMLGFETREIEKPEPTPVIAQDGPGPKGGKAGKEPTLIEVQEMAARLVKQFSGGHAYNVSNKQFLQEVRKHTSEFAQEGYFERAARYRDVINVAYVREQNLDAPLGFILAMSRSKFVPDRRGAEEGLWKMTNDFATANAYNGLCGTETLSDPQQNCAAKASALYMKAVVFGVFDGDVLYSVAAFGKSPQDAAAWKATLPANRADIWNSIRTTQERDALIRFFAAGIVVENPQKFGLKNDRPISELYRVTM